MPELKKSWYAYLCPSFSSLTHNGCNGFERLPTFWAHQLSLAVSPSLSTEGCTLSAGARGRVPRVPDVCSHVTSMCQCEVSQCSQLNRSWDWRYGKACSICTSEVRATVCCKEERRKYNTIFNKSTGYTYWRDGVKEVTKIQFISMGWFS